MPSGDRDKELEAAIAEGQRAYAKTMERLGEPDAATPAAFGVNLKRRQKALQEMLAARQRPLSELNELDAFTRMWPNDKK